MGEGIRNKTELILALLYAGERPSQFTPVIGITRLEKLLFLLKTDEGFLAKAPEEDNLNFVPFRMGPWTNEIYDEVDFLESLGLLKKQSQKKRTPADAVHDDELFSDMILDKYQNTATIADEETEIFTLSEEGKKKTSEIWARLSVEEKQRIMSVKHRFNNMNLKQFLRYVYKKYPEYTTASEIKDYLNV